MSAHADAFQLSPQQRVRWLAGLPPATLQLELNGPLDLPRLTERLAQLVANHEALRLRPRPEPGLQVPLQWVDDARPLAERIRIVEAHSAEHLGADDGQITLAVDSLDAARHRLQLQFPALAADRGTLLRIARALGASSLPPVDDGAMSYTQYSAWLYDLQGDEDAEFGRRFWASQASYEASGNELLYRERRSAESSSLSRVQLDGDARLAALLESFCQRHGATAEEVLLAAWCALLQRLSTDDAGGLNLHWVHDCRDDYEELTDCWGLFAKALPLSWQAALEAPFSSALSRLRSACEQAREWQEYCGVVGQSQSQTLRYGFEWGGDIPALAGLQVQAVQAMPQALELLLVPESTASGYRLNLEHDASCYSRQAALTLLEQYQSLLLDALAHPEKALSALSVQAPGFAERLDALQPVGSDVPAAFVSLPDRFSQQARTFATQPALRDRSVHLSYQQLDARSNRLAQYLREQGLGREDRVALFLERSAEMVMAMLAVLKSGAAFLPLDTQQPAQRTLSILQSAAPALILTAGSEVPTLPGMRHLDLAQADTWQQYPDSALDSGIRPEDAAYVLFTSGSTGTPKGVVVEHRQLVSYVGSILQRLPLAPGDRSAVVTSLAADLGYTLLFPALLSGGELHVVDKNTTMDAQAWADYQTAHGIDHLKIVPSLLDAWLGHAESGGALPAKSLVLGGETCSKRLLDSIRAQAPALAVYNHYGPTETTIGVLMHPLEAGVDYRRLPLSLRLDGVRVYLLDDQGQPVAPGQNGELYIAGPQVARGYLDPQQARDRFIDNPQVPGERVYRTGDLARYRPDGSLEITGRADRQVKVRGYRVELDEVEAQLAQLPGVAQAAVEYVPRGLFAFITQAPGHSLRIAQLQGQAQDRLPDYMLPTLRIVESLPLMGNGKLDRKTLRQWADKVLDAVGGTQPRTPLEGLLAQLWADVLGLERVGIEDDFFALGGHSLAAVKLASRLQKALATSVSVNAVFSAPSVMAFAALVQEQMALSPLVRLSPAPAGNAAPARHLFCFHPSTGHVQDYRTLFEPLGDWTLWGLQAAYLTDSHAAIDAHSIDSLATLYVEQLRQQQADGPYHLLGWSLGGLLAIAAAAKLEQAGQQVAFLGVVDSQYQRASAAQSVAALLESAEQALTPESQAYWRQLPTDSRESLRQRLAALPAGEQLGELVQWARQQGLQLAGDSWEHLAIRLGHHAQTQHLLASFQMPALRCPVQVWWASDTLAEADFGDPDWARLNPGAVSRQVIEASHLTILQQPDWQRQLSTCLDHLPPATVPAHSHRLPATDETA
ncbi:amino acid adenylation domain-containing protein [Pseudomonas sp. GD03944]|uniref:non-ribosomal peptide synthetase n=1 Tax=Pseudomonas sp. GD03944 TaxID=2975409 RepID=UPI00244CF5B8|nr:amino acid adenylation domain-containing protein [Pseudomonas sp. GD03944]MDH1265251.1 amino acid adenylation domain-containing protein [Pseudomonas sp. GD03944]